MQHKRSAIVLSNQRKMESPMSLRYDDDKMADDDGLNLTNCGYAILLVSAYTALVFVIGAAFGSH